MNESSRCRQLISLCQLEFPVPRNWLLVVLYKFDISICHYLLICLFTNMWRLILWQWPVRVGRVTAHGIKIGVRGTQNITTSPSPHHPSPIMSLPSFYNTFTSGGGCWESAYILSPPPPSFILHNRVQQLQVLGRFVFYHASVYNTSVEGKSAS